MLTADKIKLTRDFLDFSKPRQAYNDDAVISGYSTTKFIRRPDNNGRNQNSLLALLHDMLLDHHPVTFEDINQITDKGSV